MHLIIDSYMGIFLPDDLPYRINMFIEKKLQFPFIKKNELIGIFYFFGKDYGINNNLEVLSVNDIAKRTMQQISRNIHTLDSIRNKLNSNFVRETYLKRALQISIEEKNLPKSDIHIRIATDPTILSSCFEQHVTYYKQDYFFKLFQPFKKVHIPKNLTEKLYGRMLMICYNASDNKKLPYDNILSPFFNWLSKN